MSQRVYFTLEEARILVPFLEERVIRLRKINNALEFLGSIEIENEGDNPRIDIFITKLNMNYYKQLFFYHKLIVEILSKGIVIRDLEEGVADFYAKYNEEEIHFCWRFGEKDILFWHGVNHGFGERKPIHLLEPKMI